MNKNQHYKLTRIFIPFLVTVILASSKPLSGVTVTLSSERLGDKKIQSISL